MKNQWRLLLLLIPVLSALSLILHRSPYSVRGGVPQDSDVLDDAPPETALIMPCTFRDAVLTLPKALNGVIQSQTLPYETIIVFGMDRPLIGEIAEIFPIATSQSEHVNIANDRAREALYEFFYRFSVDENDHSRRSPYAPSYPIALGKKSSPWMSKKKNATTLLDSLGALEFSMTRLEEMTQAAEKDRWSKLGPGAAYQVDQITYIYNLYQDFLEIEPLIQMAEKIPNFKIILNPRRNHYANSNRELGVRHAFRTRPVHFNQIISFVDCDDTVVGARTHLVEKAFQENPDVDEFAHGFIIYQGDKLAEDPSPYYSGAPSGRGRTQSAIDFSELELLLQPEMPQGELLDQFYEHYMPFRDPLVKQDRLNIVRNDNFLKTNLGTYIKDPRDCTEGNIDGTDDGHFSWFLNGTRFARISEWGYGTDRTESLQNGHTSWRRNRLQSLMPFPNCIRGEDARLSYLAVKEGALVLPLPAPLTWYILPGGEVKRNLIDMLIVWNKTGMNGRWRTTGDYQLDHEEKATALKIIYQYIEKLNKIERVRLSDPGFDLAESKSYETKSNDSKPVSDDSKSDESKRDDKQIR